MSIDLYTWPTPNGRKISIALEEMGLAYEVHPVHIGKDEQFAPSFLAISPNNKIPAIVDRSNGRSLMESGAILLYLADKTGQLGGEDRWITLEWLMLQMGGVGPMLGQANHFLQFNAGKSAYAEKRYGDEAARLYGVLDRRLAAHEYLAGKLFHRRHRHLAVDFPLAMAPHRLGELPASCSLVHGHREPPGRAEGLAGAVRCRRDSPALATERKGHCCARSIR